jgi:hypothetical protein
MIARHPCDTRSALLPLLPSGPGGVRRVSLRRTRLSNCCILKKYLAERVGFEPTVHLLGVHTISNRAPSASRAPLHINSQPWLLIAEPTYLYYYKLLQVNICIISIQITKSPNFLAERVGFEPTLRLLDVLTISSRPRYDHFGTSPYLKSTSAFSEKMPESVIGTRQRVCLGLPPDGGSTLSLEQYYKACHTHQP